MDLDTDPVIANESAIAPILIVVPTNEEASPGRRPRTASKRPIKPKSKPNRPAGIERRPRNGTQQIRAAVIPRTSAADAIEFPFLGAGTLTWTTWTEAAWTGGTGGR